MRDFDLVVIGAGAAGLSTAYVAAQLGLRLALIERGRRGGECLNVGCVPSKALLAAAHAAHTARRAGLGLANRNHRRLGSQSSGDCARDHCSKFERSDPQSLHVGA